MKKYIFVFALSAIVALTACGTGSTTTEQTDSTSVNVDSSAVSTTDSTEVATPTDSSKKEEVK
jgi:uncharacterized lipoprotein YehR (DUF1307 family)